MVVEGTLGPSLLEIKWSLVYYYYTVQLGQNFLATLVLANLTLLLTYLSTFKVTGKEKKVVCGKGSEDEIGS